MMKNCFLYIFFFLNVTVYSQPWNWLNKQNYEFQDYGEKLLFDSKNNFYVLSYHTNANFQSGGGYWYYYLQKFDSNKNLLWRKKIQQFDLVIRSVFIDNDTIYIHGSYQNGTPDLIPGQSGPPGGSFVLILDSMGNFADGHYIFNSIYSGMSSWELGNLISSKAAFYYVGRYIGKFAWGSDTIISGSSPNNEADVIIKFDRKFNVQWYKTFYHTSEPFTQQRLHLFSNKIYLSGNFKGSLAIDGQSFYANGYDSNFLLCLDTLGNVKWLKSFGSPHSNMLMAHVVDTNGSSFFATNGYGPTSFETVSVGLTNQHNYCLLKCDSNGALSWIKQTDWFSNLRLENNKLLATVIDTTNGDKVIQSFDLDGILQKNWNAKNVRAYDLRYISKNSFLLTGGFLYDSPLGPTATNLPICNTCSNFEDFFVLEMADSVFALGADEKNKNKVELTLYPNPSSGIFTLKGESTQTKISVHDVLGNCVWNKQYRNEPDLKIDLSDQPKGIYFVEISADDKRVVRKIVIE